MLDREAAALMVEGRGDLEALRTKLGAERATFVAFPADVPRVGALRKYNPLQGKQAHIFFAGGQETHKRAISPWIATVVGRLNP